MLSKKPTLLVLFVLVGCSRGIVVDDSDKSEIDGADAGDKASNIEELLPLETNDPSSSYGKSPYGSLYSAAAPKSQLPLQGHLPPSYFYQPPAVSSKYAAPYEPEKSPPPQPPPTLGYSSPPAAYSPEQAQPPPITPQYGRSVASQYPSPAPYLPPKKLPSTAYSSEPSYIPSYVPKAPVPSTLYEPAPKASVYAAKEPQYSLPTYSSSYAPPQQDQPPPMAYVPAKSVEPNYGSYSPLKSLGYGSYLDQYAPKGSPYSLAKPPPQYSSSYEPPTKAADYTANNSPKSELASPYPILPKTPPPASYGTVNFPANKNYASPTAAVDSGKGSTTYSSPVSSSAPGQPLSYGTSGPYPISTSSGSYPGPRTIGSSHAVKPTYGSYASPPPTYSAYSQQPVQPLQPSYASNYEKPSPASYQPQQPPATLSSYQPPAYNQEYKKPSYLSSAPGYGLASPTSYGPMAVYQKQQQPDSSHQVPVAGYDYAKPSSSYTSAPIPYEKPNLSSPASYQQPPPTLSGYDYAKPSSGGHYQQQPSSASKSPAIYDSNPSLLTFSGSKPQYIPSASLLSSQPPKTMDYASIGSHVPQSLSYPQPAPQSSQQPSYPAPSPYIRGSPTYATSGPASAASYSPSASSPSASRYPYKSPYHTYNSMSSY